MFGSFTYSGTELNSFYVTIDSGIPAIGTTADKTIYKDCKNKFHTLFIDIKYNPMAPIILPMFSSEDTPSSFLRKRMECPLIFVNTGSYNVEMMGQII